MPSDSAVEMGQHRNVSCKPMITRRMPYAALFGLALAAAAVALRWYDPAVLQQLRDYAFDQTQRLAPRPNEAVPVTIVDIDEPALARFGQWPWPRTLQAKLLNRLTELGAAAVAYDILFSEPDRMSPRAVLREFSGVDLRGLEQLPDNDETFAAAISGKPVVLSYAARREPGPFPTVTAGFAFTGDSPLSAPPPLLGATLPLPVLAAVSSGLGDISMNPNTTSPVVRTVPLFLSDGRSLYPTLALEALRVAQGASTYIVANAPERPGSIAAVKVGDFEVPTTAAGEILTYMAPASLERYVSASDVLADASGALRERIEGHIVFVGTSAPGLLDIRATPLGELVPGVSIHAQIAEQILAQRFLNRPDWADGAEIVLAGLVGLLVVLCTAGLSPVPAVSVGLTAGLLVAGASWYAFRSAGILLDSTYPVMTALFTQFAMLGFRFLGTDRDKRRIRKALSQYVSPGVLARVESQYESLKLGGEEREISILFMDVRNFTAISERLSPNELVSFINRLLSALSEPVIANEGTLDKFIGDSIMAFWNAPVDIAGHATKAARSALSMRVALGALNAGNAFGLGIPIGIGVGLNTGIACVGNMGSVSRFNYSAVGDTVNVAARIEAACKEVGFDLLVSEAVARQLPGFALLDAGEHALKGKSAALRLFLLAGDDSLAASTAFREIAELHGKVGSGSGLETLDHLRRLADMARPLLPELAAYYEKRCQDLQSSTAVAPAG